MRSYAGVCVNYVLVVSLQSVSTCLLHISTSHKERREGRRQRKLINFPLNFQNGPLPLLAVTISEAANITDDVSKFGQFRNKSEAAGRHRLKEMYWSLI
jgi:hypothetical protein